MRYILLFLASILSYFSFAQSNIDVLNYKFEISLNDESDSISGKATIQTLFQKEGNDLTLDFTGPEKGRGMYVFSITDNGDENKLLENSHIANKLKINFPEKIASGTKKTIIIRYKGIPADGLIISKNIYGNRTFFADNWPDRGHNWLPCNDDPADKATVEFIVTAPQHYQVVSNGMQIEETNLSNNKKRTHWREDVPISTKVMVIGVAEFAVSLAGTINNCIPVYSWVYPEDREKGFYDYAQAAEILPWFVNNIGPYAYKKLANVQSKTTFGGLENANTIFYSESSVTGTRKAESLLAHEIAHQWFGNYATEKSFAHLWLSEGFATYMTILYMESKYGKDTAVKMLQDDREQAILFGKTNKLAVVNPTTNYMELLNANSYEKGGWVLHMLRKELGDAIFWKGIQKYYATYGGKTADTEDLEKIFENVSGKNLKYFFQQWLYVPENPSLAVNWKYDGSKKRVMVNINQLQEKKFQFPLSISFETKEGKKIIQQTVVDKKTNSFSFSITEKPVRVIADPHTSLLSEIKVSEVK